MVLRNLIIKILPDDNLETLTIRLCEQIPGMVKQLIANLDSIVEDLTKKKKQDTFASYEKKCIIRMVKNQMHPMAMIHMYKAELKDKQ